MSMQPLSAKQRRSAALAEKRLNVWEGAVRSGKTIASMIAWLAFVRRGPAGPLLMVGRTERTLKRNIIDPLTQLLGAHRCQYVQGRGELELLGRRIYIVGANDERAQEKIRGLTLAGAYVDEASTLPESFWSMLLSRLSVEGARLYATTNPDSPTHWLKRSYLDRPAVWIRGDGEMLLGGEEALELARFSFRLADNETLPAAYVTAISREFAGLWHKRFILGEWVAAEGAVYEMLEASAGGRHVESELPALDFHTLGIDYGTTNPFHALIVAVGADERLHVCREWRYDHRAHDRKLTDADYSRRLMAWLRDGADGLTDGVVPLRDVVLDPSAASFRAQLRADGWSWASGADNAVLDGIRSVASLLAAGRLVIHESCEALIRELEGYAWDPKASERGLDAPLKEDDHGPDALRYAVMAMRRYWRSWITLPSETEEAA